MAYRLIDDGYPFKKIMHRRRWIGRVGKHLNGGYLGTIGNLTVTGTTERDAFEQVVAKHLGFANAAALHAKTRAMRAQRRAMRNHARHVADQMLHGNYEPLMSLLEGFDK